MHRSAPKTLETFCSPRASLVLLWIWCWNICISGTVLCCCENWKAVSPFLHSMSTKELFWWLLNPLDIKSSTDWVLVLPVLHFSHMIRGSRQRSICLCITFHSIINRASLRKCIVLNICLALISIFVDHQRHPISCQPPIWSIQYSNNSKVCYTIQKPPSIGVGRKIVFPKSWTCEFWSLRWWTSMACLFEKYMRRIFHVQRGVYLNQSDHQITSYFNNLC